jgi:hypothetical protein
MTITPVTAPPQVPSKYDIIPIHSSDVASFKRCRRYWDWTSPTRTNLRRRVEIYGINVPLWFGTGIHYALEMYYNPALRRDPVEAFQTWFELQWVGGTVEEEWLERSYDLKPFELKTDWDKAGDHDDNNRPVYKVRGLRDLLPQAQEEEFEGYRQLGTGMMEFYRDYALREDEFVVVAAESVYSIPLGFEWVDQREDSPNYGNRLEVHARGKRDAIIHFPENDYYGIIDHKTAAVIGDQYFKKLEKDEQCSNYIWASQQEALIHDLPYKKIDGVLYQALRKAFPRPPTILEKSGFPSLNRNDESTTAELFEACIKCNPAFEAWFQKNDKAQLYYTYLVEMGDKQFIERTWTYRSQAEISNTGEQLKDIALDMLDSPRIYPTPTGEYRCLECAFRSPCIAKDDGSDWKSMLTDGYETNLDR